MKHWLWAFALFLIQPPALYGAERVRVAFPSLATALSPSWVTSERGIWKKYGLDVELIYLDGGARTVSALLSGSVQLIIGSDVAATVAMLQGANLIRLGVTTNSLGYSLVTQQGINSIKELKGKVLGITRGRDAAYARLTKILRDSGLNPKNDVKLLTLGGGPSGRVAALKSGMIHGTMLTPPIDLVAEKSGMKILSKIDVPTLAGGINTSTTILQKNRSMLLDLLKGYMEGIRYMTEHKEESLRIFSKYLKSSDVAALGYLYDEITARLEPGLRAHPESIRFFLDLVALDYPQAQQLGEKDHWDLSLIEEIQQSGFLDKLYKNR